MRKAAFVFSLLALIACVISFMIVGCNVPRTVVKMVDLNREKYICKIDPSKFSEYRGKHILLSTIVDESKNTSNLYYYNPDQTIAYNLYYSSKSMQQPVVSYYWYALQKAFECAGINIEESGSFYDAELSLIFTSLTDEEIQFNVDLIKKRSLFYSKSYVVRMPKIETNQADILEQRAYGMLDSIVTTILNDADFQKAVIMNTKPHVYSDPPKGVLMNAEQPFYGDQKYSSIKGIVLRNGNIIKGKIIIMNIDKIRIQTPDGTILSYPFDKVERFIKE